MLKALYGCDIDELMWKTVTRPGILDLYHDVAMDEDVDMDAPQISTLREQSTPPPSTSSTAPPPAVRHHQQQQPTQRSSNGEDGEEDEDDQEDQLIDDDDPIRPSDLPPPPRPTAEFSAGLSPAKRKAPAKRKPRKSEKRPPEEGRLKEKVMQQPGAPNLAPTMSWFEANPSNSNNSESHDAGLPPSEGGQITMLGADQPLSLKIAGKKKAATKKAPAQKKVKTSSAAAASTSASAPPALIKPTKIRLLPPPMPDDSGIVSEGMTGTAASSPVAEHFDDIEQTPDPEPLAPIPSAVQNSVPEEINLEGIPIPVYTLPTKPFPVLPPPKVGSGFAPSINLDRSGTKARHWRVAKREIRGIAGGRWFAQGWVGEKDSAFASQMETQAELRKTIGDSPSHVTISKMVSSVSAPVTGKGKAQGKGSSLSVSAAPSRSESQAPEVGGASISVHAPTKMRISQVPIPIGPASEAGDSDMMGPPDT
ncbi:hypothetical protein F5890DRAFT_1534291 [Lentinula detonsa]|uniref:Uncharacterized protein n=1 Tax=Lentinula detonsa TaxID=2804962 RepID=A0AA38UP65_9AGAR|nr:hypothetical protein F5890DRAFT_1534291 [Lentinula detonsa]